MAAEQATISAEAGRPGWAAVAAALVAIGTLYMHGQQTLALPLLGVAFLASCATRLRLPKHPLVLWPIRILLFAVLIFSSGERPMDARLWFLQPEYTTLFGYLCAAELAVQCWQRRKTPPYGEVMILSALIMAAGTGTITLDARVRQYTHVLVVTYVALTVVAFRDFGPRTKAAGGERPWRAASLRWGAVAAALGIGSLIAMGLKEYGERFTVYPLMSLLGKAPVEEVGFSLSPRLAESADVRLSPKRVLRVEGPEGEGHLRGVVFDTYTRGQWGPNVDERRYEPAGPAQLQGDAPGQRLRITKLADNMKLLFAPLNAAGIAPMKGSRTEWDRSSGCIVRSEAQDDSTYVYEVALRGGMAYQGPLCVRLSDEERSRCLAVPEEVQRGIGDLARRIAPSRNPPERVREVAGYLQANHAYSLAARPGAGDRVCDFVLNKRAGHCQYFASSAVMLLRCVGVPARFVTGYYAHESDGRNARIVRQRDAHAWAECWIDGVGWITLDVTPAVGRPDEAFEDVGFWRRLWERLGDRASALGEWFASLDWTQVGVVCGGAIGLVAGAKAMWRWWRGRTKRPRKPVLEYIYPGDELAGIAVAFEKVLRRHGAGCPAHRTWREHVAALADDEGRRAALDLEAAREFLLRYEAVRFGRNGREGLAELRDLLGRLQVRERR